MKRAVDAVMNTDSEAPSTRHSRRGFWLGTLVLSLLFVLLIVLFARSYKSLRDAILYERMDYVDEISAQIMTNQIFMETEYANAALNLKHVIESDYVLTLDDVHQHTISIDQSDILLVREDNALVELSGRHVSIQGTLLSEKLIENEGVFSVFTSLNYAEDNWLFVAPIVPKAFDGWLYKAIVLSISADEYRSNMAISLFDGLGASYIISNDGRIKLKPLGENLVFDGFNLFSGMADEGAAAADIDALKAALNSGEKGSRQIVTKGINWLIGYAPISGDTSIIVAVPLTFTAAKTYAGLEYTIVLSTLSVLIVAMIALMLILRFVHRDRRREKEALAVAAKSEFFSKMSHDIRTPLNAVIGLVQLAHDGTQEPETKYYLKQSFASAKYLLSIINDVLDVSRIDSGKLTLNERAFDMGALVDDVRYVVEPFAREKDLDFEVILPAPFTTEYIGDNVRIAQILTNLLSNATKFTKHGGRVTMRILREDARDGCDKLTMIVSDTGIGMTKQFISRLFLPFEQEQSSYTQQYAGTGLGLAIVNSLIKLMNGTIDVVSEPDHGSEFTVEIKLKRGGAIAAKKETASEEIKLDGKRVLLVEDSDVNQLIMSNLLARKFNIETDIASDGREGVKIFSDSENYIYDMILMDIKMPNMDGLEATRAIRALNRPDARTIPIVALSANAFTEDMNMSLAAGMNAHLSKPVDVGALAAVLKQFLDDKPSEDIIGGSEDED